DQQYVAAILAVGVNTTNHRKQHDRRLPEERVQAEEERIFRKIVNQPALRQRLHPGADAGGARAEPHQPKIAILEGFENATEQVLVLPRGAAWDAGSGAAGSRRNR